MQKLLLAQQEAVNQSHIPSGVRSEAESMECSCTYIPCHKLLPCHPKSVRNRAVPNHRVLLAIRSMQSQPKLLESLRGGCNRRKQRMADGTMGDCNCAEAPSPRSREKSEGVLRCGEMIEELAPLLRKHLRGTRTSMNKLPLLGNHSDEARFCPVS